MGIYEFNFRDLTGKANHLWEHGEFIGATDHEKARSAFYTLDDFYVEVIILHGSFIKALETSFLSGSKTFAHLRPGRV